MRTAPLALALTLLTACQPGGGGGEPQRCGPAANGEACAEDGDCACGNTCVNARCLVLADAADAGAEPEPEPEPAAMPDPNAQTICQQLDALPCIEPPFTVPRCVDIWNEARARAIADDCAALYDTLSACQARGAICPDDDDFYWPDCADELAALDACQCGDGISEVICLEGRDGCFVGSYDFCDLGAEADCVIAGDHYECTCETGTEPGLAFAVPLAAGPCCGLEETIIATCGEGLRPPGR